MAKTLSLVVKDGKTYAHIKDLKIYEGNEKIRFIEGKDFEQLKADLQEFGDLGPLLVNTGEKWGTAGEIFGGNTRIRVYKEQGVDLVWVEPKTPENELQLIRMMAIHNRTYSQWNPQGLAELVKDYDPSLLKDLQVQLAHPVNMNTLVESYGPSSIPTAGEHDAAKEMNEDDYMSAAIKQITLLFDAKEYDSVVERLKAVQESDPDNLKNNTDVFLFLLNYFEENQS